jgi:uncharacterized protein YcnI
MEVADSDPWGLAVFRRSVVALVGALVLVGVFAAPAFAHVTVSPDTALQGADQVLVFSVPNESDTASTTTVEVAFPEDHPIATASVLPVPGWTAKINMTKAATPIKTDSGTSTDQVANVTWTGGTIAPGQFQQFTVNVGLPADGTSLAFKTVQTYSDGTIVRWVDLTTPGGAEPANPAPIVTLTKTAETTTATTAPAAVAKNVATSSDVDSAKTIGIIGIVLGGLGLIVAITALVRKRAS